MPLFNTVTPVEQQLVSSTVAEHWQLTLDNCIKASQNHTFQAHNKQGDKFVVRVTPDPGNERLHQLEDEMSLLQYMDQAGLSVCGPIASKNEKLVLREGDLNISVFPFAHGAPLPFPDFEWMTRKEVVVATGRWLGSFHVLSRQFSRDHPEIADRMRAWSSLHDGVMAEYVVDQVDLKQLNDPQKWGVLHGDVNPSNWFWNEEEQKIVVFDWDQCQQGWFMLDVAQCCHAVVMLKKAGMPCAGTPVPQANPEEYMTWLQEGYEAEAGAGSLDREQLDRMLKNRHDFYRLFCERAVEEGNIPDDMRPFIQYVVDQYK